MLQIWVLIMITQTELLEIIRNPESTYVEFKRDDIENSKLAREIVAFLNTDGGMVLLGIEDDGTISGITRSKLEEWVITTCREKVKPPITPFFETIKDVEPGKDVAIVRVNRGLGLHSLWHKSTNYYIRSGSQCRAPSDQELGLLFQNRKLLKAELCPISGATLQDLDYKRLRDYFGRIRQQQIPEEGDDVSIQKLLTNTELMVEQGLTLACLLLFGKRPNRFLDQAGIDAAAYPTIEKDNATLERATLRGPAVPLMNERGELIETGLVEQALDFVKRNTSVSTNLKNGVRREEILTYPCEVIREAVVNALIHRDYLFGSTDIELSIYKDRLEIISPGNLPFGITPEKMRAGARSSRNPQLKDIMRDYGYLESMGMGISRKIINCMRNHNQTEPELIVEDDKFVLRLFA